MANLTKNYREGNNFMTVKKLFMIVGLSLIIGCSMAALGSHATADLKDKEGKTVGKAIA